MFNFGLHHDYFRINNGAIEFNFDYFKDPRTKKKWNYKKYIGGTRETDFKLFNFLLFWR